MFSHSASRSFSASSNCLLAKWITSRVVSKSECVLRSRAKETVVLGEAGKRRIVLAQIAVTAAEFAFHELLLLATIRGQEEDPFPLHSSRSATTGSTRVARSAGMSVAASAIDASRTDTPTNVVGSVGVIE